MSYLGVIGGSGIKLDSHFVILESSRVSTNFGEPSALIQKMAAAEGGFSFLARHGNPHKIAPHQINYRANLQALSNSGCKIILAINAVGAISQSFLPSQLVIPDQVIDYTWGREHTVDTGETGGLMHVDFTAPFDVGIRNDLIEIAHDLDLNIIKDAVIGVTQGPRLESAAEIRRLRSDGCDLVGMTSMPEAAIARELKLRYASICIVSNLAAGISKEKISIDQIKKNLEARSECISTVIREYVKVLEKLHSSC